MSLHAKKFKINKMLYLANSHKKYTLCPYFKNHVFQGEMQQKCKQSNGMLIFVHVCDVNKLILIVICLYFNLFSHLFVRIVTLAVLALKRSFYFEYTGCATHKCVRVAALPLGERTQSK